MSSAAAERELRAHVARCACETEHQCRRPTPDELCAVGRKLYAMWRYQSDVEDGRDGPGWGWEKQS